MTTVQSVRTARIPVILPEVVRKNPRRTIAVITEGINSMFWRTVGLAAVI